MSAPHDSKRNVSMAAVIVVVFLGLAWLGNAAFAASNSNEYSFNDPIEFGNLWGDMVDVSVVEVIDTAFSDSLLLPLLNVLFLASAIGMAALALLPRLRTKIGHIAIIGLAVPYGLLGVMVSLFGPFDGEFVEEGFTAVAVCGPWLVFLICCSLVLLRTEGNNAESLPEGNRQSATT